MTHSLHPVAREPEDISRFFVERARSGDVEGVVALYESDAVLVLRGGAFAKGTAAIREAYTGLFAVRSDFEIVSQQPAVVLGDLALTSSATPAAFTAEVARRQPDGSWLWILDRPNVTQ